MNQAKLITLSMRRASRMGCDPYNSHPAQSRAYNSLAPLLLKPVRDTRSEAVANRLLSLR